MNPFDELVPAEAIILTPLTDVKERAFGVSYPDEDASDTFRGFYLVDNTNFPHRIDASDLPSFLSIAYGVGITVVVVYA